MHIAMIGTRGVPAKYGGFETAVEEVGSRLVERGFRITVYCRNEGQSINSYQGMDLVNLPALRHRAAETLSHSGLSVLHAMRRQNRPDAAIVFNAANAPFLRLLTRAGVPAAVHMDGIEWKRAKWAGAGARYYRWAERKAATSGLALIADAEGIADHLRATYDAPSHVIAYGAPILHPGHDKLADLDVKPAGYHLVVARMEPENHVEMIVDGYARAGASLPLVVVGSAPYGDGYVTRVQTAARDADVRFLGGVWDQDLLNQLYGNCRSYLHGHSVGGTNPSLLRAMGCAAPVTAFDVNFNREVTGGKARFFSTATEVAAAVRADEGAPTEADARGSEGQHHVSASYRWDDVAERYERLAQELVQAAARSATARRRV